MRSLYRRAVVAAWIVVGLALFGFGCGQLRSHQLTFGTPFGSLSLSADGTGYAVTLLDASDPLWQYKHGPNQPGRWDGLATWQASGIDVLNHPWVKRLGFRHTLVLSLAAALLITLLGSSAYGRSRTARRLGPASADETIAEGTA